ncbi:uncharacterized protein K460DRAFT_388097 [Cucurbitaria berberidis CBS 394.84]|uniref:Uncharacterized protein n=1 Tax=Cucurbitaria berberidis CBS 394.84 TaxID=1168544 RepID=A0A9P4GFD6_9PLEO|nr:uncharacterized protein K460DRAFT_388097 [Cucurbitaria berberidis CBS 394.84]KAF1844224.1 hypothetical protein K460DRAFT_388097 [Cucurbitaria berberidis CBS 394.84]
MEAPIILPSTRLFIGPSHELFGFDRIWVSIFEGRHRVLGRNGDDTQDLKLLTRILEDANPKHARISLWFYLTDRDVRSAFMPSDEYHYTPHPHTALNGQTPLVWTVDFDQNRIFYDRDGMHLVHYFRLPDERPLRLRQFRHYIPSQPYAPMQLPMTAANPSTSKFKRISAPRNTIPPQLFDFVYRLAHDYEVNWRTSKFTTESYGLQQLANGILSCFTLNFRTQEIFPAERNVSLFRFPVDVGNLLRWRTWPSPPVVSTVSVGDTHILLTERIDEAMTLVNEHFASVCKSLYLRAHGRATDHVKTHGWPCFHSDTDGCTTQYIVTTIREIQYFRKTCETVSRTRVSPFFNGPGPPSRIGVRWMLNAIHGHAYPMCTPIHKLPIELQYTILDFTSAGSYMDRAMYAGVLGIGDSFDWKLGTLPLKLCQLSRKRTLDNKRSEHQVLFWDEYVAMSYQVKV